MYDRGVKVFKFKKKINFTIKKVFLICILAKTIGGPINLIVEIGYLEYTLNCDFYLKIVLGWTRGHFKGWICSILWILEFPQEIWSFVQNNTKVENKYYISFDTMEVLVSFLVRRVSRVNHIIDFLSQRKPQKWKIHCFQVSLCLLY